MKSVCVEDIGLAQCNRLHVGMVQVIDMRPHHKASHAMRELQKYDMAACFPHEDDR